MPDGPRTVRAGAYLPGLVVALAVAAVAVLVNRRVSALSAHVLAVACGIAGATFGHVESTFRPGFRLAARHVLRAGIVVLGVRLSLGDLGDLGPRALAAVVAVVVATFFGIRWLAAAMGVSPAIGLMMATGYSICGASAVAAVEPFAGGSEEDVAVSLSMVTLCGTLAIVVLPPIGRLLGLDAASFGAWVGASVHDVGQVVATASTRDSEALRVATVVKLTRVILLAPLLSMVALGARRRHADPAGGVARPPLLPVFVVLFLLAVAVRTSGVIADNWLDDVKTLETVLLAMGLFGLGTAVNLRALVGVGGRSLVLALTSWALIAAAALGAVHVAAIGG
jgi:uncharacterized integral membrane protein (TIGR00698 family)